MRRADTPEGPATFERVVSKNASLYHYMKISLELENESTRISAVQLKLLITSGLKELYGEVGAAFPFDLLKFDENTLTGILRVYNRLKTKGDRAFAMRTPRLWNDLPDDISGLVKLWSALTLLGSYQNEPCALRVTQVSPFLLSLAGNSRDWDPELA